jgi:uncharacterized protein (DUF934 family)
MTELIKNGNVLDDPWKTLRLAPGDAPHSVRLPVGPVLVPVAVWKARRAELIRREYEHGWPLGIWLSADESPAAIENDLDDFTVIAVEFDQFNAGSRHLTARLLRERYGYRGELRAIGEVPMNMLAYLHKRGFDAIAAANGQLNHEAIQRADFSQTMPQLAAAA